MKQEHITQIEAAVAAVKSRKISQIYFVACGGSMAMMFPSQYIVERELNINSAVYTSNEFIHRAPKALGAESLVITCSHSGNTPETVKATVVAREKGALTIALSNLVDSPLWKACEFPLHYDWGDDLEVSDARYGILYAVTFGVLNAIAPNAKYVTAIETINKLTPVVARNKELHQAASVEFGSSHKRDQILYTMASGASYGCAYSFAICLMMEMQWVHSSSIHSGEYFHGPFEITDYDVPFLMIKGLDECRPLDERAHAFCQKYTKRITLIDAEKFEMDAIPTELRGYFAPIVIDSVLRIYAEQLADHRGHPLSVRRYMWRMEY